MKVDITGDGAGGEREPVGTESVGVVRREPVGTESVGSMCRELPVRIETITLTAGRRARQVLSEDAGLDCPWAD